MTEGNVTGDLFIAGLDWNYRLMLLLMENIAALFAWETTFTLKQCKMLLVVSLKP